MEAKEFQTYHKAAVCPDATMIMLLDRARSENIIIVGYDKTWYSKRAVFESGDPVIAYGGSDQWYFVDVGNINININT